MIFEMGIIEWFFILLFSSPAIALLGYGVFWLVREHQRRQQILHIPLEEKLAHTNCPKCERPMKFGYVTGWQHRLRWASRPNTKTIFAGKMLYTRFSFWSAPSYEAYRCSKCGVVIFSYDPQPRS